MRCGWACPCQRMISSSTSRRRVSASVFAGAYRTLSTMQRAAAAGCTSWLHEFDLSEHALSREANQICPFNWWRNVIAHDLTENLHRNIQDRPPEFEPRNSRPPSRPACLAAKSWSGCRSLFSRPSRSESTAAAAVEALQDK